MALSSNPTLCTDDIDTVHMPVFSCDDVGSQGEWDPDQANSPEPASKTSPGRISVSETRDTARKANGTQVDLMTFSSVQVFSMVLTERPKAFSQM